MSENLASPVSLGGLGVLQGEAPSALEAPWRRRTNVRHQQATAARRIASGVANWRTPLGGLISALRAHGIVEGAVQAQQGGARSG
jgi:hypothetical protein